MQKEHSMKTTLKKNMIKKKNYVDIIDNYILLIYLVFFLIYYLLNIFYNNSDKISLKNRQKFIIFIVVFFIEVMYYITHIIKFYFTGKIIKKELMKKYKKNPLKFLWFYKFDIGIICTMSINIFLYLILILYPFCGGGYPVGLDDIKKYYLRQINGFDICDFELPLE